MAEYRVALDPLPALSLSHSRFAVGSARTAQTAAARRKASPRGTTIRFSVTRASSVRITCCKLLPGRKVSGRCVADRKSLRCKAKCTRQVAAGWLLRRNLTAGKRALAFSGRIGRTALSPGACVAVLVATDSGGRRSPARTVGFTILPR